MPQWCHIVSEILGNIGLGNGIASHYLNQCWHLVKETSHDNQFRQRTLAPGKFEWNFRYLIFQKISVLDGWGISCELAFKWMSVDLTDDKSTFVQVMAWCHQAASHYLSQCWPRSLSPYGVTRPQWFNNSPYVHWKYQGFWSIKHLHLGKYSQNIRHNIDEFLTDYGISGTSLSEIAYLAWKSSIHVYQWIGAAKDIIPALKCWRYVSFAPTHYHLYYIKQSYIHNVNLVITPP